MSTVKEEAAQLVEQLPENATWDDLMYRIYVHQKLATAKSPATARERQEPRHRPGASVEVIVLEPETSTMPGDKRPGPAARELRAERKAALERTLRRSFHLGGQFPSRNELHER